LWAVVAESGGGYSIRKISTSFVQSASVPSAVAAADAIRSGTTIVVVTKSGTIEEVADTLPGAVTSHAIVAVGAGGPLYTAADRATLSEGPSGTFFAVGERHGS